MSARAITGWVALVSGALLVIGMIGYGLSGTATELPSAAVARVGFGMMGSSYEGGMMHGWGRATGTTTTRPGAAQVAVRALSFNFDPGEIRLPRDAEVDLTLTNPTAIVHDLTVPALGIHLIAPPGSTRVLALSGLPAGRYVGYCSIPGHAEAGMRMTVIVQ